MTGSRAADTDQRVIIDALGRIRHGVLATLGPTGMIHSVLVNPFWVERQQSVVIFSRSGGQKVVNIRSRQVATLTLVEDSKYLSLVGTAFVMDAPEEVESCIKAFAAKYRRLPAQADDRVAIMMAIDRVLGGLAAQQ